jgi:LPXTG-motif cell wall-anchored protein
MKKSALLLNNLLIVALFLAVGAKAVVAAPHLIMSPASGNYSVGDEFSVTIKVDSGTETAGGVDGVGTYDSTKLDLVSAIKASPMVFEATDSGGDCAINSSAVVGKFSFSCYSNDALNDRVLNGDLVILNFRAKATGTAVASFTCTSGLTTDSNIVKTSTANDVIVCAENVNGSYVIAGGTGGTTTATPTPTTASTSTSTSTTTTTTTAELPQTGGVASTIGLIVFGVISLASALFLKFL